MKYLFSVLLLCLLVACRPDPVLEGHDYTLQNAPLSITLSFDAHGNRYTGKAVNRYFGTYTRAQNSIRFSSPQSSMLPGNEEDMAFEETYLNNLSQVISYHLSEEELTLILSDKSRLVFARTH